MMQAAGMPVGRSRDARNQEFHTVTYRHAKYRNRRYTAVFLTSYKICKSQELVAAFAHPESLH